MRTAFRIAKLELSILFYSPIAWLVLVIFMIQSGLSYIELIDRFVRAQDLGNQMHSLTDTIYASQFMGFFKNVQSNLYLYMPLLTMGLMSRELSSGSIKLLLSSPVKIVEIVMGKYMAIIAYGFALIIILFLYTGVGYLYIEHMDVKLVLSGIFGLYLLICTYSAIGLFMSCLTSYQVVAAISTLVVFAGLNYVGGIGQHIDFVRDLTYFLSIAGRTGEFIVGLITSKDVLYFLVIIFMFLGFCVLKLRAGRESKSLPVKLVSYAFIIILTLMVGYVSSRPGLIWFYDATFTKRNTLTENSQQVVKEMNRPLTMTAYVNLIDENATHFVPQFIMNDGKSFEQYLRFLPKMKMNYVYYYDSLKGSKLYADNPGLSNEAIAKKVAGVWKIDPEQVLSPEEIRKQVDLSGEGNRTVRLLDYDGRRTFLRIYDDLRRHPGEPEVIAALKRLQREPVKVGILTGNHERSIGKMGDREHKVFTSEKTFRNSLVNQGFEVDTISLVSHQAISEDLDVLVIADPRTAFSEPELGAIYYYIDRGGDLLVMGEPGRQSLLKPVLDPLGVKLMDGIVLQQSEDFAPDFVIGEFPKEAGNHIKELQPFYENGYTIALPGAAAIQYTVTDSTAFKSFPILLSNKRNAWNSPVKPDADVIHLERPANSQGAYPLMLGMYRQINGKEQQIVIAGDADFMSNGEIFRRNPDVKNFYLTNEIFRWFSAGAYPIDTTRPETIDNKLLISADGVFWLRMLFIGILPGSLVLSGGLLLLIRKRR